jgi:hypothetical protein
LLELEQSLLEKKTISYDSQLRIQEVTTLARLIILVSWNLAFRRHRETLSLGIAQNSRIFKDLVKLLCAYDTVLHEHFHCIHENEIPHHSFK